jgi:DNA replication protein DnaC
MNRAAPLEAEVIGLCRTLKLPAVARDAARLGEEATRQGLSVLDYLSQLLHSEVAERGARRAQRRLKEATFPRIKTMEGFDFTRNAEVSESHMRRLANGEYIDNAETVILVGEPGTGKTHLATALGVAAAQQGRRVRFATSGWLVNELIEARDARELNRLVARYTRVELLVLDELAYLPLSKSDAELLFQVLSERHERRALIITTNLPFAEWTSVFPNERLCRAVIDRLTHRAHIIETGTESVRLLEALKRQRQSKAKNEHST